MGETHKSFNPLFLKGFKIFLNCVAILGYIESDHKLTEFKTLITELEKYEKIKPNG